MAFNKSFDVTGGKFTCGTVTSTFSATKGLRVNGRYETKEQWAQAVLLDVEARLMGVTATLETGAFDLNLQDIIGIATKDNNGATIEAIDTQATPNKITVSNGSVSGLDIEMRAKEYINASVTIYSAPIKTTLDDGTVKKESPIKITETTDADKQFISDVMKHKELVETEMKETGN